MAMSVASSLTFTSAMRRVSFQEDTPSRRRCVGLTRGGSTASKVAASAASSPLAGAKSSILKNSVTVLHGRVVKDHTDASTQPPDHAAFMGQLYAPRLTRSNHSIRDTMERKSTFYQLTEESAQFQKQVASLETAIRDCQSTPESAWRMRVLLKTAQDLDQSLWTKLYEFEKTLLSHDTDTASSSQDELRVAQTACMKLHRDFKRSHKALLMCLSLVESHQLVDGTNTVANSSSVPLKSTVVGWATTKQIPTEVEGDVDDIRQRLYLEKSYALSNDTGVDGPVNMSSLRSPDMVYTSFREVHSDAYHVPSSMAPPLESRSKRKSRSGRQRLRRSRRESHRYQDQDEDYSEDEERGILCGAFDFDDDDSSVRNDTFTYERFYRAMAHEFILVHRDVVKVGRKLGCAPSESEAPHDVVSSGRFPSASY